MSARPWRVLPWVALLGCLAGALPVAGAARDGDALWRVVHDLCVRDSRLMGRPAPCAKVDLGRGYAVVRDPQRATQLLLVPTARITGVEDPKLLEPDTPNYWALAWENRGLLDRRAGRALPRDRIALVVNSAYARTQNQLHLHIDCVRSDVAQILAERLDQFGATWRPLAVELAGHRYLARWISDADLATEDPFKLAAEAPDRATMARQTLVLVGATAADRGPGFVLLSDQADRENGDTGHGEDLLDHDCRADPTAG